MRATVDSAASTSDDGSMEEIPLMAEEPRSSGAPGEARGDIESGSSHEEAQCRICLETSTLEELEEPCACKGSLQRVHHACLQRWINEREQPHGRDGALKCEICKQPYSDGFTYTPPPAPPSRSSRGERVMVGQELYVIVVDPQTGIATARQLDGVDDLLDEETEERFADRLNPLSACAISFFLFMGCSLLLSHLFHSLPEPSPETGIIPGSAEDEAADAEFQDLSATLLLLWLLMRLLVLIAPVYTVGRFLSRVRETRARLRAASEAEEVELHVVESGRGNSTSNAVAR